MGYVHPAPRRSRSADRERREVRADIARIDRKRHAPQPPVPLVSLEPAAVEWWPTGNAWLKTEESGA